jgi:hypothetical protein
MDCAMCRLYQKGNLPTEFSVYRVFCAWLPMVQAFYPISVCMPMGRLPDLMAQIFYQNSLCMLMAQAFYLSSLCMLMAQAFYLRSLCMLMAQTFYPISLCMLMGQTFYPISEHTLG